MPRIPVTILHAVSGIYAGGCVTIAAVDVAFIRAVGSEVQALASARALLTQMGKLMLPQLLVMLVLSLGLSATALRRRAAWYAHLPLLVVAGIWLVSVTVHFPINAAIFSEHMQPAELQPLMARWELWHWVRTVLALSMPAAVIFALGAKPTLRAMQPAF